MTTSHAKQEIALAGQASPAQRYGCFWPNFVLRSDRLSL